MTLTHEGIPKATNFSVYGFQFEGMVMGAAIGLRDDFDAACLKRLDTLKTCGVCGDPQPLRDAEAAMGESLVSSIGGAERRRRSTGTIGGGGGCLSSMLFADRW